MSHYQRTVKRTVSFSGIALHTGDLVTVEIRPASPNSGIVFQRTDLPGSPYIKANPHEVHDTSLATRVGTREVHVSTIEHLMAAFFGFGLDNAIIAINNAEMPILDGSAAPFLVLLDEAGFVDLQEPRKVIVIKKTIEVVDDKNPTRFIRIEPSKVPLISYAIDFQSTSLIGKQHISLGLNSKTFCEEFSYARTFCLKEEIDYMRSRGLALGGSLENAIVVSKTTGLVNQNGLRSEFEFVKHKILDCIGDLHMLGMPLLGHIVAHKAGHDLHNKLARAILSETNSRKIVVPSRKELATVPFKELLSFPRSLSEISRNLMTLVSG